MTTANIMLTIDQNRELIDLNQTVQGAVAGLNTAITTDVHSDIAVKKSEANDAISRYNETRQNVLYSLIMATENPMLTALTIGYVDVLKLSMKREKDSDIEWAEANMSRDVIDLIAIENMHGKFSKNGQWRYWVEKFTFNMAARASADVGYSSDKFAKAYRISDVARSCDIGATPTSTTQMVKQLQLIADAIIFKDNGQGKNAYKVINADVNYILYVMCKRGKTDLSISMPRTATMIKLITEVMHRIVTDGAYTPEFETKR